MQLIYFEVDILFPLYDLKAREHKGESVSFKCTVTLWYQYERGLKSVQHLVL